MTNAVIKSNRPAAAAYNGVSAKLVRKVDNGDPAYNDKMPQVIAIVNDREHYFYADEVVKGDGKPFLSIAESPGFDQSRHPATADQAAWDSANMLNTVASMENYLMLFPMGTRAAEARHRRSAMAPGLPQLAPLPDGMAPPKPPEPTSGPGRDSGDESAIRAASVGTAKDEDRSAGTGASSQGFDPAPRPIGKDKAEDRNSLSRNQSDDAKAKGK